MRASNEAENGGPSTVAGAGEVRSREWDPRCDVALSWGSDSETVN